MKNEENEKEKNMKEIIMKEENKMKIIEMKNNNKIMKDNEYDEI